MTRGDFSPVRHRLHAERTLMHEEGACLPLRSRHGQCTACAAVCPAQALTVSVEAVVLTDACSGCGRCTAVCPTQALSLPELQAAVAVIAVVAAAETLETVRFECRLVPQEHWRGLTRVLPCLGALTPGHLMAAVAQGQAVEVVERGWCSDCLACGAQAVAAHPAAGAMAVATLWLESVRAEPGEVPLVWAHEALPKALRPAALPALAAPEPAPVDRRHFFRAALNRPAGRERGPASPMGGDGRAAYPADARQPSPERARQHAALQTLAAPTQRELPAEFFPALLADASCCDARMCTALCPTAALVALDDGAAARLQFDPVRCIACGTCVRACPEGSLHLQAHGGAPGLQILATHPRLRCASCGDAYSGAAAAAAAPAGAGLCPLCAKSRRFIDDARQQLFGAPN